MDAAKPMRVLLVDDNEHVRKILHFGLSKMPNAVIDQAVNGYEALRMIEDNDYDLLVLDYYMPIMTGGDLVDRLQNNERTRGMPVVIVSANGPEAEETASRCERAVTLMKPMRAVDLRRAVDQVCALA
jgi:two-component system phosphate regulon response regulator PhoB